MTYFLVDGDLIKSARDSGRHDKALRVFRSGYPECRSWGAAVSGTLRVYRTRTEDEFRMEILKGDFECASPMPDMEDATKHIYVQQSIRHSWLKALIFCQRRKSLYHNDILIVGDCEIVYDCSGKGFHDLTQLWIQTTDARIIPAGPWTRVRGPGVSNPYLIDSDSR